MALFFRSTCFAGKGDWRRIARYAVPVAAVTLLYALVCVYILGTIWQRKEGDLPPASPAMAMWEWGILSVPFYHLGVALQYLGVPDVGMVLSLPVLVLLNGLFWGVLVTTAGRWVAGGLKR